MLPQIDMTGTKSLSVRLIEQTLHHICTLNRAAFKSSPFFRKGSSAMFNHPMERTVVAMANYYLIENTHESLRIQTAVVDSFKNRVGETRWWTGFFVLLSVPPIRLLFYPLISPAFSDSYLDLAGSMNDLGVYHTVLSQFDAAEKVLKRALQKSWR